jgi:cell division protein FtsI (penicillin-binding protein 3)
MTRRNVSAPPNPPLHRRTRLVSLCFNILFLCILGRLFYWQVIKHTSLQAEAEQQYTRIVPISAHRGKILTSDGYALVDNQKVYRLFAQPDVIQGQSAAISQSIAGLLAAEEYVGTDAAELKLTEEEWKLSVQTKLSDPNTKWATLKHRITEDTKQKIAAFNFPGVGFDPYEARSYPEASMAAHVTGFVGKDKEGEDQGYFGVEGALDRELRGQAQQKTFLKDALGFHLLFDHTPQVEKQDGRNITLTIRRDVQYAVEEILKKGIEKYGATAGEVIVMDPKTGKILALAAFPSYAQADFAKYDPVTYKNPLLTDNYEPGSIFKILTVAAGIDSKVITPETQCDICSSPRKIGEYTIKTWNEEYHPNITMTDALVKSDNVAMIFIAELLGKDRFLEYIRRFGIGDETRIDLQEDGSTPIRKDWKPIDLATASFGQGIVTNGMQMVRAVGAIANQGRMMRPTIIEKVSDPTTGTEVEVKPLLEREVVSPEAAKTVTQMMVFTAENGEAKWTASKAHIVAAKTGTAQIPIAGHYDPTKTIASFIGFSPPDNPRFVMLVKLREPSESQWAAETAAPVWYEIANRLFLLLNVPPDK